MRIRQGPLVGALAAVTAVLAIAVPVTPAAAAAPARAGDFNGDGRRDLAFGSPYGLDGSLDAGFVTVVYGGSSGPNTGTRQVISQSSAGIPGGSEEYDAFGYSLASADFDRDGYADLAIGAPGEDSGGAPIDGGRVTIVYGGSGGLTSRAVSIDRGGRFGETLATGDFDRDGSADLAVGDATGFSIYRGLATGSLTGTRVHIGSASEAENSSVQMTTGDFTGDGHTDLAISLYSVPVTGGDDEFIAFNVYQGTAAGVSTEPLWSDESRVSALTSGDVNGDGRADLIAGASNTPVGGEVRIYRATGTGFSAPQVITQESPDVPGTGEPGDGFGHSVGAADVDGDGRADVVVGSPNEDAGTVSNAGAVTVLYGTADGLSGARSQLFGQNSSEMPGSSEANDVFGSGASLADLTGDGKADLVAGAPGENGDEGAVWVLRGSATGVTVSGVLAFNPGTLGVGGRHARLGAVLLP